ncbi:hypothetical protein MMC28_003971 [Mycoblastus sanguinarius]|nr:hypothetical protein [Mycoblastus sanguinarius]
MDYATLCQLQPHELAYRLRDVSSKQSVKAVSDTLLAAIERESLPPTVFNIWLSAVDSVPLAGALWQQHSKHVRMVAISQFGEALNGSYWKIAWDELGGINGLLHLFAQLSVLEVRAICKAIGRCAKWSRAEDERDERITGLFKSLYPSIYPGSQHKSTDQRPLHALYAYIVPACTSDFVNSLLLEKSNPVLDSLPKHRIAQHHFASLRQLVLDAICGKLHVRGSVTKDAAELLITDYLPPLLDPVPQLPGTEPGFSASMCFSVAVLEEIAVDDHAHFPARFFLKRLMIPLMRRMVRRGVEIERVQQIVNYATTYLKAHRDSVAPLSLHKGDFLSFVANYWSKAAHVFQEQLVDLIKLHHHHPPIDSYHYESFLCAVEKPLRYRLLQLLFLHSQGLGFDIDSDEELNALPTQIWTTSVFLVLRQDHALSLLKRLISLKPEGEFLQVGIVNTILCHPSGISSQHGDPQLLRVFLGQGIFYVEARASIQAQKTKASQSRDQAGRAFFAKSASFYAIASGSLDLYGGVVLWLRRFLGDAKTVRTIYSMKTTNTSEGVSLLSGITEDLGSLTSANIRERVKTANKILLELLGSAIMALRQPGFNALEWNGPLGLFQEVVMSRMKQAGKLKKAFQIPDGDLYDILWDDTVDLLLKAERIGLIPEHEALGFNSPHGPFTEFWAGRQDVKPALPSTFQFLDNLARERDKLWRDFRRTLDAASVTLEPPWPRGLPIQCLIGPFNVATESACDYTPFIASRAARIVTMAPVLAFTDVPNDKGTRHAIGQFFDSYQLALKMYVMQRDLGQDSQQRLSAAWSHAVSEFSQGRMSEDEAPLCWKEIFEKVLPSVKLPIQEKAKGYPILPNDVIPSQNTEWDPTPLGHSKTEVRDQSATALDCMLEAPQTIQWHERYVFSMPKPKTRAVDPTSIWSLDVLSDTRRMTFPVREGLTVAALLLHSSIIGGPSRILASPFPSDAEVRYPSLFLDQDFLLANERFEPAARRVLSRLMSTIPPRLLLALTNAALQVLSATPPESTKIALREHTAYMLLKLLATGDRPQLASNLILRTIIDRPDASSWHRQLLKRTFLRSLPALHAQGLISSLASSIRSKLEEFATLDGGRSQSSPDDSNQKPAMKTDEPGHQPIIKVTTVKFLAQILDAAGFIPAHVTIDILSTLFQTASHIDIRVAVVDNMLSSLARCNDDYSEILAERWLSALETTIPVMASLNERAPLQEADWIEVEQKGILPQVYKSGSREPPPILERALSALASGNHRIPSERVRRKHIERILLPAVEQSRENNARWMKIFVSKHSQASTPISTPSFPVKPQVLAILLKSCFSEVPASILNAYHQFVLTNILPTDDPVTLSSKVAEDASLRNSNEGKHWLSLYGQGAAVFQTQIFNLASILGKEWQPSIARDAISIAHVQSLVIEQAAALLRNSDPSFSHWSSFISALEPPLAAGVTEQDRESWLSYGKPTLKRIISHIDHLRTPEWQRNPNRQPKILPPTFDLRLLLLDYPHLHVSPPLADRCTIFTAQLVSEQHQIIELGIACYARLGKLEATALKCLPDHRARVACCLGDIGENDTMDVQELVLRVELADVLFRGTRIPKNRDDELVGECRRVLEAWRASRVEEVRMKGYRVGLLLEL